MADSCALLAVLVFARRWQIYLPTLLFVLCLATLNLKADGLYDLKILDQQGLMRLAIKVSHPVEIVIVTKGDSASGGASLTNVNGLSPDIGAKPGSSNQLEFSGVAAGTWKLSGLGTGVSVAQVKQGAD